MDWEGIGRVAANTTIAACAGGFISVFFVYPRTKKWDLGISVNGFLGGLVAITAPCYWVSPGYSVIIGAVAGIVVVYGIQLLEYLRIDDPIGAVPVHMFCGIWGTLSLGLFAAGKYGVAGPDGADNSVPVKGLFTGGGADQLKAQLIGSISCVLIVTTVALIVMFAIRQLRGSWNLRLERDLELEGLDISEHGTPAYHMEFGYGMSYTTPTGSSGPLGSGLPKAVDLSESENRPV
jgi:Amt family ammonium transporter